MNTAKKISLYVLILLPVFVLAIFSFVQTKKQLIQKVYQERQNIVAVSANVLRERLDRLNEIGVAIAAWPVFQEHFEDGKWHHAVELLQKIPKDYSYINHALILDTSGMLIAGSVPQVYKKEFSKSVAYWYPGISKRWEPYLSEVYHDPVTPDINVSAMAVPIKDSLSKIKGILLLEVDVKKLLKWINGITVGDSGFMYVVDQKGQVAIMPSYLQSTGIPDYSNVPAVKKALSGEKNVEVLYNPVEQAHKLVAYEKITGYGWAIIAQQDTAVVSNIYKSLWPVFLFFAFVITMAVLFARVLIKGIEKQNVANEQLELLTQQINEANDAIYTLNSDYLITSWNQGAQNMYGFTEEEVLGKNSNKVLQTDLSDTEIKNIAAQINKARHWSGDLKRKTKAGKEIYVHSSNSCIINDEGKITGFVAVNFDITEQKKLREQLNHFANIVEQSGEAIFSTGIDRNRSLISWNKGAEKLFGFSAEEVIGKSSLNLGIVQLSEEEKKQIDTALEKEGSWQAEKIHYNKNGSPFYGAVTANVIKDESNNSRSVVFFVRDISLRKGLEDQLKELNEALEEKIKLRTAEIAASEKKYRYLFENNPLPIWIIDIENFRFLDVNQKAVEHYGYSREEFLTMTALDIRPGAAEENFIQANFSTGEDALDINRGIWPHIKKDGSVIKVQISALPINFGEVKARLILANDVTEQEQAKEKLAASEKLFRALIENSTEVITMMDASFKLIYRSPAAEKITGWSNEDMINVDATKNIHADDLDEAREIVKQVMANPGKQFQTIFRNLHKKGHYIWMEGTVTNWLHDDNVKAIVFNYRDVTEKREAAEKLIESEKKYRTALDNMMEGVQIIGFDWKYIYVNDAVAQQSNYSKEQFIGRSVMELFPGVENTPIFENCLKCMNERTPILTKTKMIFPDNREEWFEQSFQPVPEGIFILSVDITEKIKAEEKLKAQTAQLQTLSNNLPGVMIFQITGSPETKKFTYISKGITPLTGNTPEEVMNNPLLLYNRILPEDLPAMIAAEQEAFLTLSMFNVEARLQSVNDGVRWLNIISTPRKGSNGEIVWDGFHVDITDRKKTAEAIKKSEEHYRLLVEQSADGIFLCDILGNCIAANTSGCKMLGYTLEEIVTKNLTDAVAPEDHHLIAIEIMKVQDGSISLTEWRVIRKDGSLFIGEVIARMLPDGKLQLILRDITERKESELRIKKLNEELENRVILRTEQLKKSNEEMEAFTYSVSHDLRAPLRGIVGFTSILEEEYSSKLDAEALRLTSVIKTNTLKMGNLIDDLLKFSRISRHMLDKTLINTDEMVKQVIASPEIKTISSKVQWTIDRMLETNGDLNTIRQVWINLISNAIKYSSEKPVQLIEIGSYRLNTQVVFFIKDNGVGFEQAYSHKLFKVFQRLHNPSDFDGTGVGLAIVEKIISKHGGKVWAKGEVDKGATFYFSLPDNIS